MPEIKATNSFVFIIVDKPEAGNDIFIPEKGVEKQHHGKIITVGKTTTDPLIKGGVGKTAYFHQGAGFPIEYNDIEYTVLTSDQIIAIV